MAPTLFTGFLNVVFSLTRSGVSTENCEGSNFDVGVAARAKVNGDTICPQGRMTITLADNDDETMRELNLLLTGGRLSSDMQRIVRGVYDAASHGEKIEAAQQAIMMTPEFNTLGDPLPLGTRELATTQPESASNRSYKASVLLCLWGGADTFSLIVPLNCGLYEEYAQVRTDLALTPEQLLEISAVGQGNCTTFGVHDSFSFLHTLYEKKEAAFISNIGSLVEPTTMETWYNRQSRRCENYASHRDGTNSTQTLRCQDSDTTAQGYGGRICDSLASGNQAFATHLWAIGGVHIWNQGFDTRPVTLGDTFESGFTEYDTWRGVIANITGQRHGNVYADTFTTTFSS